MIQSLLTVLKTDVETGKKPQGDASLAGAVYGIYKSEELVDTYTTDENGQFTTKYYVSLNYCSYLYYHPTFLSESLIR